MRRIAFDEYFESFGSSTSLTSSTVDWGMQNTETECVAELMKMYQEMTK